MAYGCDFLFLCEYVMVGKCYIWYIYIREKYMEEIDLVLRGKRGKWGVNEGEERGKWGKVTRFNAS